jgi:hypothetical protein
MLRIMMVWQGRGFAWSKSHNSRFKTSKSKLVDFTCSKTAEHPPLILQWKTITPQETHKFIGAVLDQELWWNQQANYTIAKAAKWTVAFQQLARPSTGIWPKLMC